MKYLSLFSGYGGFELGIQQAYKKEKRELLCEFCDKEYFVWFTQNELWNEVCGIDGKNIGDISFLCPNCFIDRAEKSGASGIWEVRLKKYDNRDNQTRQRMGSSEGRTGELPERGDGGTQQAVCIGYSEIDKYAVQTYSKHFPEHKNYGDITKINARGLPDFDLFVGGVPCQSWSIAGKRGGFEDPRGNMWFESIKIIREKKPKYFLLENVKGLLSHDGGKSMERICEELCGCGYAIDFEVLNAKNFGVPQNRERVFIIGFRLDLLDECQIF